jgi:streptomycin 6-kinase
MIAGLVSLQVIPMCSVAENNWRVWWPSHADAIAADIRARLTAAVAAWQLSRLEPLPGGEVALVFAATTPNGDAVLKLSPRVTGATDALAREGAALALWADAGIAPHVLAARDDGLTLLMERVRPGHDLRHADAAEIVQTLGALCPQVHLAVAPGQFQGLGEGSEARSWRHALAGTRELSELERLLIPSREDRLLHTDLHWLNALRGPHGWVVIDPKPHVGDPHADVFAFFDGPPLSAMPDRRPAAREHVRALTASYARAAGLDRDRIEAWIRIRALAIVGASGEADASAGAGALGGADASGGAGAPGEAHASGGAGAPGDTGETGGPGRAAGPVSDRSDVWSERLLRLADAVV